MKYRIYDGCTMSYQDRPSTEDISMKQTEWTDILGTTIWECDIVDYRGNRGVVEWDQYTMRFGLRVGADLWSVNNFAECEVIGNAFQHVDLLK